MCVNINICKCLVSNKTHVHNFHPFEDVGRGSKIHSYTFGVYSSLYRASIKGKHCILLTKIHVSADSDIKQSVICRTTLRSQMAAIANIL